MRTQYLQKSTQTAVLDECSSWIERIRVYAAKTIAAVYNGRTRQAQLFGLRKLSQRQLRDVGLDDPQVQICLFDARIESQSESLENLRNQLQVRW